MIKTNKLIVKFDKNKIQEDFDIYKLSLKPKDGEEENFFEINVLDLPQQEFMARSVVYTYNSSCYVMFDKNTVEKHSFKVAINEEYPDTTVQKLDFEYDEIYPNILAKLLFNMLYSSDSNIQYKNITGKLYYMNRKWMNKKDMNSFHCIEVNLDKDMYLELKVRTFSKLKLHKSKDALKKAQYIIDPRDGLLKRKLKNENVDRDLIYIQKSLDPKNRNTVDFLKIRSIDKFYESKLGILSKFMEDVKNELKDYITVEHGGYDNCSSIKYNPKDSFENKDYASLLNGKDIVVEDLVNTDESKKIIDTIISRLENDYKIKPKKGHLDKSNFNLRIINNKDYYKQNELEDLYNNIDKDTIVQHITVEGFTSDEKKKGKSKKNSKNREDAIIGKILQELIIKDDINKHQITLADWEKYRYDSDWTFVMRKKVNYTVGEEEKDKFIYCKMKIFKDGKFDIEFYDDSEKTEIDENQLFSEFDIIEDVYNKYNEHIHKQQKFEGVEGLIYKSIENINVILKTKEFVMPNYDKLKSILEKINPKEMLDVEQIINCIEQFVSNNDNKKKREAENKRRDEFLAELRTFNRYETRRKVKETLKFKSNAEKVLNTYLYQKENILINVPLKGVEGQSKYFDAVVDIKYVEHKDRISYFVGLKEMSDLQFGLNNAVLVREIRGEEKIEFEEIAKLLQVEFVKYKQYTVIPFPFKYIREALKSYI